MHRAPDPDRPVHGIDQYTRVQNTLGIQALLDACQRLAQQRRCFELVTTAMIPANRMVMGAVPPRLITASLAALLISRQRDKALA